MFKGPYNYMGTLQAFARNETDGVIELGQVFLGFFEGGQLKACFRCPCGCHGGISIPVSIKGETAGEWGFSVSGGLVTITPSIQQPPETCGTNFRITEGEVTF